MNKNDSVNSIKIAFMGTPDFSVPILKSLINDNFNISCVFTQSGKPAGRGMKRKNSPIYNFSLENNLTIRTPLKLDEEEVKYLSALELDVMIVVAYGLILPESVLELPKFGCINIHASLLPQWRGAAPIQRAIMAGDKRTGVSYMLMEKGLDTGPVLASLETEIGENDSYLDLHNNLSKIAAKSIKDIILNHVNGELIAQKQDNSLASYAEKITKNDSRINWELNAFDIKNLVNAMRPSPGAWTKTIEGKRLKIISASVENLNGEAGVLLDNLIVGCGEKSLKVNEVQPEGKKVMSSKDYLLGKNFLIGERIFE